MLVIKSESHFLWYRFRLNLCVRVYKAVDGCFVNMCVCVNNKLYFDIPTRSCRIYRHSGLNECSYCSVKTNQNYHNIVCPLSVNHVTHSEQTRVCSIAYTLGASCSDETYDRPKINDKAHLFAVPHISDCHLSDSKHPWR